MAVAPVCVVSSASVVGCSAPSIRCSFVKFVLLPLREDLSADVFDQSGAAIVLWTRLFSGVVI